MITVLLDSLEHPPGVYLFKDSELVGGWRDQGDLKYARIAAEVLKALDVHSAMIVNPCGSVQQAQDWWDDVEVVTIQTPVVPPPANFPLPSSVHPCL